MRHILFFLALVVLISGCIQNSTENRNDTSSSVNESINVSQNISVNEATPLCSDGTSYGSCSIENPKYCDNGQLIDKCSLCGCLSENECQGNESCAPKVQPPVFQNPVFIANGTSPMLYGDKMVFTGQGFFNRTINKYITDVYVYDIPSKTVTKITDSQNQYIDAHIYGDVVVYGKNSAGETGVYLYNIATGERKALIDNYFAQFDRYVYKDLVGWLGYVGSYPQIYIHNLTDNQVRIVTNDSSAKDGLVIADGVAVVNQMDSTNGRTVVVYDLFTLDGTRMLSDANFGMYISAYGINVAYGNYASNLKIYNTVTKSTTTGNSNPSMLYMHKNKLVWVECAAYDNSLGNNICSNYDAYLYDIGSDSKVQITNDAMSQMYPTVYEGYMAWSQYNFSDINGAHSIYLYKLE
jgi:hypothetical protein